MIIEKNKAVSIHFELTDESGEILDSTRYQPPLEYLHGAQNILPALEKLLDGKEVKSRVRATLPPNEAYGEYNEDLAQIVLLADFPNADQVKLGTQFQLDTPQGPTVATITELDDEKFTIDLNHPLAGRTLYFDIEVTDIRDATSEEIRNGHIHSDSCGCGHDHEA